MVNNTSIIHKLLHLYLIVFLITHQCLANKGQEENDPHREFWDACAHGRFDVVKKYIQHDPDFAKKSTQDGESCLHLTAISNSIEIAKLVIEHGANVNLRVTHPLGLRMTPLAWHTNAGNTSIVKLLLENGAEVNASFDAPYDPNQKVTALDVAQGLLARSASEGNLDDKFVQTFLALKQQGGLPYAETQGDDGSRASNQEL